MPANTHVERRDRAVLAFAILSRARDGAIATFRLKHLNLEARTIFQDCREVKTKGRKTFTSNFFPIGPEPVDIIAELGRSDAFSGRPSLRPDCPGFDPHSLRKTLALHADSLNLTREEEKGLFHEFRP
jgi:hypothetical protein